LVEQNNRVHSLWRENESDMECGMTRKTLALLWVAASIAVPFGFWQQSGHSATFMFSLVYFYLLVHDKEEGSV
jgi:hypothetical protein